MKGGLPGKFCLRSAWDAVQAAKSRQTGRFDYLWRLSGLFRTRLSRRQRCISRFSGSRRSYGHRCGRRIAETVDQVEDAREHRPGQRGLGQLKDCVAARRDGRLSAGLRPYNRSGLSACFVPQGDIRQGGSIGRSYELISGKQTDARKREAGEKNHRSHETSGCSVSMLSKSRRVGNDAGIGGAKRVA
jgi:hypothetical protein